MNGFDPARLRHLVEELASALQAVVLTAEQLARSSAATAQDAKALLDRLERAMTALQQFQSDRNAR